LTANRILQRRIFRPGREISGPLYRAVLEHALADDVTEALLVVRKDMVVNRTAEETLDRLKPFIAWSRNAGNWPGTRGLRATVRRYQLSTRLVNVLVESANGVFDWVHPGLPEDLSLLRSDGTTCLGTVAHEQLAWFDLTDTERERLLAAVPELAPGTAALPDEARRKRRRKRRR
jgi:hypothetical protein